MRRGEVWWVEFDERRPVVLLSEDEPSGFRAMQVVAPADTDFSGLGIEVAVGVPEGLPFEGVLRFAFPWPGFTPCTWLTTLSRDDLIERAGAVSTAKLSEIDDALRASEQRTEWTPAAAARLSEIKDSVRRRTQADGEGTDAHADEGRSRPHDRRSAAPQQQDHDLGGSGTGAVPLYGPFPVPARQTGHAVLPHPAYRRSSPAVFGLPAPVPEGPGRNDDSMEAGQSQVIRR